jgi:type II secretory ATPase GspE/PulE/Tfp pilus assembly ATPase PilB-like protein
MEGHRLSATLTLPALGLPFADFDGADPLALALLPERWARQHLVYPLRADNRTITIATNDPNDLAAEQAIGFATARRVIMHRASRIAITEAIDAGYSGDRAAAQPPVDTDENTIALATQVIRDAVESGASDIHIEPGPNEGTVRLRIDGVLRPHMQLPMGTLTRVVSRIKVLARLDIADRTRPQDGRARVSVKTTTYDLRVSTIPTRDSEKAVVRVLRPDTAQSLEDTGMAPRQRGLLRQLLGSREGIVLVTGPTGSGKTTTLYAALREVAEREVNITTVEDPIEYELPGITQVQVEPKRDITFASALRAILRQDPDVILVGEIRDLETAEIALQASLTGHLVLATLHTNDALSAVTRLHDLGLGRASIAASVRGSLAQRLVRKVCAACAVPVEGTLTGDEKRLAIAYGVRPAMRPVGCPACANTGYRGRLPIVEVAVASRELSDLITGDASAAALQAAAIAGGMRTLREAAIDRVRAGETTLQEVDRVVGNATEESQPIAMPWPGTRAPALASRTRANSDDMTLHSAASQLFRDIGLSGGRFERRSPRYRYSAPI